MPFAELHCHTDNGSNLRFRDSTVKVPAAIDYAIKLGHKALAITDHESLSAHIKALCHMRDLKSKAEEKGEALDFSLILGNEIYLIDEADQQNTDKFYHFILLAKDAIGHKQLRLLSTRAWSRCYSYKGIDRPNTFYRDIEEIVGTDPGHLISSSACLGGQLPHLTLAGDTNGVHSFVTWCQQVFGKENFFVEIQCGVTPEQKEFNQRILRYCKHFDMPWIVTNDVHYLSADKRILHENFLKSEDDRDREVGEFYESTYFKTEDEMRERLEYLDEADVTKAFENTVKIAEMCKDAGDYGLFHSTIVPQRKLPQEPVVQGLLKEWYGTCPSLKYLATSPYEQDRFFLQECEKGMVNKHIAPCQEVAERIDIEAQQLLGISDNLGCRLTSYYNQMQEIENIIWQVSIIGPGRGSACCLYCAYLMDIHQIDSLKENLPYWRHTHVSKVSLPDIDIDLCPSKRPQVFELLKEKYGRNKCLNIITFRTETLKSAIKTAAKGLGIDNDISQEISSLVPITRGRVWSYEECLHGNDDNGHRPITELVRLIEQYPGLHETIQEIEGLISGRGIHASGFYLFSDDYVNQNSMVKAPSGMECSCWEMSDSDACGALKFDLLVTDACQKIQTAMELLMKDGYMDWQGSWKATYNKYLHPDVLNYNDKKMWDYVGKGAIIDLFQFMSDVGIQAINKIKPRSLQELATASSVMRLMGDGDEPQPLDRYVAHKENISVWYDEMEAYGLNKDEVGIMEELLLPDNGCSVVQETLMLILMHPKISGFDMKGADGGRKILSKKLVAKIPKLKSDFYNGGKEHGARMIFLDYVWHYGLLPQLG